MSDGIEMRSSAEELTILDMTSARIVWLLLCGAGVIMSWIAASGVAMNAALPLVASTPVVAALVARRSGEVWAPEIEMLAWILVATAAMALTGGAGSPLSLLFALPAATALADGRRRMAVEAASFSIIGFCAASLLSGLGFLPDMSEGLSPAPGLMGLFSLVYLVTIVKRIDLSESTQALLGRMRSEVATRNEVARRHAEALSARLKAAEARVVAERAESDALREAIAARTRFFAQTSHELRTPLNAVLGFSEVMKNELFGTMPDRYREYADLIHEGGQALHLIVDDLLDLSKIDANRYEIHPELLSLTDTAAEAVRFMGDQARRRGIAMSIVRVGDVEAYADARAVRQVALNLLSNAIKFTPNGGRVAVRVWRDGNAAALTVQDTGRGLDQDTFDRVIQPFQQGESGAVSKEVAGTGLGLSAAQAFLGLHGGSLRLEAPMEGAGAAITALFPDPAPIEASAAS